MRIKSSYCCEGNGINNAIIANLKNAANEKHTPFNIIDLCNLLLLNFKTLFILLIDINLRVITNIINILNITFGLYFTSFLSLSVGYSSIKMNYP